MTKPVADFIWYDLMTPDMAKAAAFYEKVVGWRITDSGMPGMDYMILNAGEASIGGIMPMPPTAAGMPPMWNGYIGVPDVDAYAKMAVQHGGSIFQQPMDIPGVGRFAVAADPHGASFILFRGNTDMKPAPAPPSTPGRVGWNELLSGGLDAAWTFYAAMFGWSKTEAMELGDMGTYQMFGVTKDHSVGAIMNKPSQMPTPHWLYYFNVPAIDAATEACKAGGGTVMMGPHEVPGGHWIIVATDPQGATFGLLAPKR